MTRQHSLGFVLLAVAIYVDPVHAQFRAAPVHVHTAPGGYGGFGGAGLGSGLSGSSLDTNISFPSLTDTLGSSSATYSFPPTSSSYSHNDSISGSVGGGSPPNDPRPTYPVVIPQTDDDDDQVAASASPTKSAGSGGMHWGWWVLIGWLGLSAVGTIAERV